MKKIIDNKCYNTETATQIASYSNDLGSSDFNSINEELYITKKGTYFLWGEGGARTGYAVSEGNDSWLSGSDITVFSEEEAYEWCVDHDEVAVIEERFSQFI